MIRRPARCLGSYSIKAQAGEIEFLNKGVVSDAKVTATFAQSGMNLYPTSEWTPEAGAALLKADIKLWGDVIRANNISAQQ